MLARVLERTDFDLRSLKTQKTTIYLCLPAARLGTHTRNGETYTLVLTGPYETQGALDRGMAFVRGMGFNQATLRR